MSEINNLQNQNITFGGNKEKPSFFRTALDSALNVGGTMAVGAVAGGAAGQIAACIPTKLNLNYQYADMFEKAAIASDIPEYIQNTGGDVLDIVKKARPISSDILKMGEEINTGSRLGAIIKKGGMEILKNNEDELAKTAKFLGKSKEEILKSPAEGILLEIKNRIEPLFQDSANKKQELILLKNSFIGKAEGIDNIASMAKKAAKHLKRKTIVNVCIALGAMGALILNLLKTYGVIGSKKQNAAVQTQNIATHQG